MGVEGGWGGVGGRGGAITLQWPVARGEGAGVVAGQQAEGRVRARARRARVRVSTPTTDTSPGRLAGCGLHRQVGTLRTHPKSLTLKEHSTHSLTSMPEPPPPLPPLD